MTIFSAFVTSRTVVRFGSFRISSTPSSFWASVWTFSKYRSGGRGRSVILPARGRVTFRMFRSSRKSFFMYQSSVGGSETKRSDSPVGAQSRISTS